MILLRLCSKRGTGRPENHIVSRRGNGSNRLQASQTMEGGDVEASSGALGYGGEATAEEAAWVGDGEGRCDRLYGWLEGPGGQTLAPSRCAACSMDRKPTLN
jgi:hypothetical protein